MQAAQKLRTFDPQGLNNLYNAACAYARCAEIIQSLSTEKKEPGALDFSDQCLNSAIESLAEARQAGYDDPDHLRNDADLQALHELKGFQQLLGVSPETIASMLNTRSEWRTSKEWIENPEHKNHSAFRELSEKDRLETGVDYQSRDFETPFTLHQKTSLYIDLNKDGISVRVRLWPDKAYWGRVSSETNQVDKWNFLQTGTWAIPKQTD